MFAPLLLLCLAQSPDPPLQVHAQDLVGTWNCNWAGTLYLATLSPDGGWRAETMTAGGGGVDFEGSWGLEGNTLVIVERCRDVPWNSPWSVARIRMTGRRVGEFPAGSTFALKPP